MSEFEHYRGVLHKIKKLDNETLENQCKRLLDNQELEQYYDSYEDMLLDIHYNEYVIHNGNVYSVNRKGIETHEDIFTSNETENGDINFEVKYYNGGCSFNEGIEYALKNKQ